MAEFSVFRGKVRTTKILLWSLPLLLMLQMPALAQEAAEERAEPPIEEATEDEFIEDESVDESFEDEGFEEPEDPNTVDTDPNPLNPAGESLDTLIQMQVNDDLWSTMMGELPCLDATEACIRQLQEMAVGNSPALAAIDERIELVNAKIDEARENNQQTIRLGVFEPVLQYFLEIKDISAVAEVRDAQGNVITEGRSARREGFIDRVVSLFDGGTLGTINDILSLVGVPLFRNAIGGDAAAQQREIAIADLQVKIAEIENQRGNLANEIREQVMLQLLDFDQIRREFQISQEIARRDTLRLEVVTLDYQLAASGMDTPGYLDEISALDRQKADTFRAWARLRTQLVRVKILVLGAEQ